MRAAQLRDVHEPRGWPSAGLRTQKAPYAPYRTACEWRGRRWRWCGCGPAGRRWVRARVVINAPDELVTASRTSRAIPHALWGLSGAGT